MVVGRSLVVGFERVEEALLVGGVCFDRLVNKCLAFDSAADRGRGAGRTMFLMV